MSRDSRLAELKEELASLLAGTGQTAEDGLYVATVAGTSGNDVVMELGPRVQGIVPVTEFEEPPAIGATLKVTLRGQEDGLWVFSVQGARTLVAWSEMDLGSLVKATVVGLNKGGLELKVGGIRAFMPASQVALHHVEDLTAYGNQTLVCEVIELAPEKNRVVLSRRAVLEEERQAQREKTVDALAEGSVVRGKVTRIEAFGAFVEIAPGIEGLVHVSNISHKRVEDPNEVLKKGQDIEVQVLEIKEGGKRIGLGMKQLEADPWDTVRDRLREDSVINGKVSRLADFGAFVELEPGIDGLVHVSQLVPGRVNNVRDVLKVGEEIAVRVLSVDPVSRRISLSRLDPRGSMLGSEEAAAGEEIDEVLRKGSGDRPLSTNLGALFQKALEKPSE